eukprot:6252268-Alexandrium_andersonii.AAC.1
MRSTITPAFEVVRRRCVARVCRACGARALHRLRGRTCCPVFLPKAPRCPNGPTLWSLARPA